MRRAGMGDDAGWHKASAGQPDRVGVTGFEPVTSSL
jgi:hypothetical protein